MYICTVGDIFLCSINVDRLLTMMKENDTLVREQQTSTNIQGYARWKKNTRHWQVADWKKFWWITGTVVEREIRRFGVSYVKGKKRTWEIKNHESAPVKARRARSGRTSGRRRCNKWQTRASTLLVRVAATLPDGATARPKPNTKFNGTRLLPPFPSSFRNSFRRDWKRRFTKLFQHLYTRLYEYTISVVRNTSKFHWYG